MQHPKSVASRTAFDILTVESGEESGDEVVSEPEVVSAVSCVQLFYDIISTSLSRLIPMLAERRRLSHPGQPSGRLQRRPVEKRRYRAVDLHQGATRMSHYHHRPLHLLRIPKPGNRFPFLKSFALSSPQSPCPLWRTLIHHEPKHLHRRKMAILPSPARALRGQNLPENHIVLHLFLTAHSQQQ